MPIFAGNHQAPVTLISAVILTYNEEHNIGRCLDAIRGLVDDIVVVDSFSTDDTEEICREKGARFIRHAFEGYIEQKNWALGQARYDHVLSLDADEAPSEELKASIRQAASQWDHDAYSMNRLTYYAGRWIRHCGWYPDVKVRLFDRRKGRWAGVNPHDVFRPGEGTRVKHLHGDLLHYSYYTVEEHVRQTDRFAAIGAEALHRLGRRASFVKLFLSPPARFLRDYLLKLGFLDGKAGLTLCRINARGTYLKYRRLKQSNKEQPPA